MGNKQDMSLQDIIERIKDDIVRYTVDLTQGKNAAGIAIGYREPGGAVWMTGASANEDEYRREKAVKALVEILHPGMTDQRFNVYLDHYGSYDGVLVYLEEFDAYVCAIYMEDCSKYAPEIGKKIVDKFFAPKWRRNRQH